MKKKLQNFFNHLHNPNSKGPSLVQQRQSLSPKRLLFTFFFVFFFFVFFNFNFFTFQASHQPVGPALPHHQQVEVGEEEQEERSNAAKAERLR
jgi:hypothetical protein